MVFEPTLRLIDPDADPDVTAVPFTVIEAPESVLVGVTVIELMLLATEAVYEVVLEEKVGERVPEERVKAERVETLDVIVMLNELVVACAPLASVKRTVIGKEPEVDGVPEMTPVLVLSVTDPGNEPVVIA